ncbi:MAG: hypothetical protein ACREO3_00680 [Arenimonas sp.]
MILPKDVVDAPAGTLGTVIGSIGYRRGMNEVKEDAATILFRRVGSTEAGEIRFIRAWMGMGGNTGAIEDGKFKYAAFKIALPEGEYELFRVFAFYGITPPSMTCSEACGISPTSNDFSVRFTVKRGQVHYLGSFLAHGTVVMSKLGFIPLPMPSTVYYSYADKWTRDAAAFTGPLAVDTTAVEHVNLAVNENAHYYLIAEDHLVEPKPRMKDVTSGRSSFAGKIAAYKAEHPEATVPVTAPAAPAAPVEPIIANPSTTPAAAPVEVDASGK